MLVTIKDSIKNIFDSINNTHCRGLFSLLIATDVMITFLYFAHRLGRLYINQLDSGGIDFTLPLISPAFIREYLVTIQLSFDEGSLSEWFEHLKEFWIVLMFTMIYLRKHHIIFFMWSLVFLYILGDDMFMFHELSGYLISKNALYISIVGEGQYHLAQVLFFFGMFVILISPIALVYKKADEEIQMIVLDMVLLIIGLAIFGVVFDAIGALSDNYVLEAIFTVLDDSGEMVMMSIITTYIFSHAVFALWPKEERRKAT